MEVPDARRRPGRPPTRLDPDSSSAARLGAAIRSGRLEHGLTLRVLADQIGFSVPHLSAVERAEKPASEQFVAACDDVLDAGGELLALLPYVVYERAAERHRNQARRRWGRAPTTARTAPGTAIGPGAAQDPDSEIVSWLGRLFPEYSSADYMLGPRHLLPVIAEHLRIIDGLVSSTDAPNERLLLVGARYAEFACWLHQDAGSLRRAAHWADRALRWARLAGQDGLASYVLMRKSSLATSRRDPRAAVALAREAARPSSALTGRAQALAAQQEAHGLALAGSEIGAQRCLDDAHAALQVNGNGTGPGRYCGPAYIELQRATCWLRLGQPARAIAVFERELAGLPEVHRRDRGVYLAQLAAAYAADRRPEEAARAAWEALTITRLTGSARGAAGIGQAWRALTPWHRHRPIDELGQAIAAWVHANRAERAADTRPSPNRR